MELSASDYCWILHFRLLKHFTFSQTLWELLNRQIPLLGIWSKDCTNLRKVELYCIEHFPDSEKENIQINTHS